MLFLKNARRKIHAEVQDLRTRMEKLEADPEVSRSAAHLRSRDPDLHPLNSDDMAELRGLRNAITMMGLDPKKVAECAMGGPEPRVEMMYLVKARMLFSSVEPNAEKLREIAGAKTNVESWMRNWKRLAQD